VSAAEMTRTMKRCRACEATELAAHLQVRLSAATDLIPTTDRYGAALSDIVRCRSCGHMQLDRFPSAEELMVAYAEAESSDYVEEEEGQRATARAALDRMEPHVERGRLLDLGCWVGFLLAEARARGWKVTGVEPSTFAATWAKEKLGLDVRQEDLMTAALPSGDFDAVVMGDVIEHLPDPDQGLERIADLLAPEGIVYLALPDAGSRVARALGSRWWSVLPTHVQYFTRGSIVVLLRRCGYRPLWIGTAPKAFTVDYYLERLEGYSAPIADAARGAARTVGVAQRLFAPDFRDRMAVIARRPPA